MQRRSRLRRQHWSAFTLIELLAVMAIISILAALLLPGLSNSKAKAKRLQCVSNLHQMCVAAHVYVNDNATSYPIAYYEDQKSGIDYAWDLTTIIGNPNQVIPGTLWESQ